MVVPKHTNVSLASLVEMLAPSVGSAKATEAVRSALATEGLRDDELTPLLAARVMARISQEKGVVGLAAQLAQRRLEEKARIERAVPSVAPIGLALSTPSGPTPQPADASASPRSIPLEEITSAFARSMGREAAEELVAGMMRDAGLTGTRVSEREALAMLDRLAATEGLSAVAARFVKARLFLSPRVDARRSQ